MKKINFCKHCGSKIINRIKSDDSIKLKKIMEKYNLNHNELIRIIGISKRTLLRILNEGHTTKEIYWEILKFKGFE